LAAATRPEREDEPNRLVSETADGERERTGGRSVEPLDIVEDHQHTPRARALAEQGEEGRGDGTPIEWGRRRLPQQGDGQGALLRCGKLRRRFVVGGLEEVP
jgi:hypothetical protein